MNLYRVEVKGHKQITDLLELIAIYYVEADTVCSAASLATTQARKDYKSEKSRVSKVEQILGRIITREVIA